MRSTVPVVAGPAVGVALIAMFAFFKPPVAKEESTTVFVSDFGLATYYRFSDIESEVLNFEVDWNASSILMSVDVPRDTELRIRFHEHLFEQLEHEQRPEGYRFGETLTVFVDGVQERQIMWEYTELEVIATLPLEAGTKTIKIISNS